MSGKEEQAFKVGHLSRRGFLGSIGKGSLAAVASSRTLWSEEIETPRLDPDAPLRIGMIGRTGHLNIVLKELDSVPGAMISAYSFEDGDCDFNSDGSSRRDFYDMSSQTAWVQKQPWSKSHPKLYETYQEMLDMEELDLAVVCLPYARNAFAISAAAGAGLHVLSEKPVAVNRNDLKMVETAIKTSGVRLSAMFTMRYSPSILTVRNAVLSGKVGSPCLARAQKSYKWGDGRPWFYKHREIYGSTILWVGIHAVDYIRWTTGLEVMKVTAFHSNLSQPDYPGTQDNAVINLQLDGGATAAITMDYLRPETAPTHGDDRIRVAGTEGIIESVDTGQRVILISDESPSQEISLESPSLPLFADFVSELRGTGRHLIGPDEAVRVTKICIAATESAEEGRVRSL